LVELWAIEIGELGGERRVYDDKACSNSRVFQSPPPDLRGTFFWPKPSYLEDRGIGLLIIRDVFPVGTFAVKDKKGVKMTPRQIAGFLAATGSKPRWGSNRIKSQTVHQSPAANKIRGLGNNGPKIDCH